MGGHARRPRLPGGARPTAARLRGAADPSVPRRAPVGSGGATGVAQTRGPAPHRRAQGQQRPRPVPARPAHGQAADHRRDRGGPARGRHRDGVRAAWAGVRRLHGRRGHAPPASQRAAHGAARRDGRARRGRDPDAQGGDVGGDPRLDDQRGGHALRHRLDRRARAVPGARARPAAPHRRRGARATAGARGPPALARDRVRRGRLERDRHIHRVRRRCRRGAGRRRGGGGGARERPPWRAADRGRTRRGSCTGRFRRAPGRGRPDRRGPLRVGGARLPWRGARARAAARLRPRPLRRRERRGGDRHVRADGPAGGDHPRPGVRSRAGLDARQSGGRARSRLSVRARRQGPRRGPGALDRT